ncbi:MAG: hypothetical protein AAF989_06175, partial [Planctomycetota bacterium]
GGLRKLGGGSVRYVRLNPSSTPVHFGTIYSQSAARDLGISFAGECSCTCMDVDDPESIEVPDEHVSVDRDRLQIDPDWLRETFAAVAKRHPYRTTAPAIRIRRRFDEARLIVDVGDFPAVTAVYLSNCFATKVELSTDGREVGVFGAVQELRIRERDNVPGINELYLHGVNRLILEGSAKLRHVNIKGTVRDFIAMGDFPELMTVTVDTDALVHFAVPYRGRAPQFENRGDWCVLGHCPNLRLLKMPGTAVDDETWMKRDGYTQHQGVAFDSIHEIDLRYTDIGDQTLDTLHQFPSLRILRINECHRVTDEGVRRLQTKIPKLTVHR